MNCMRPRTPSTVRGKKPCSMISAAICVHTENTNGKRNCDQNVELVEPSGPAREDGDEVEDVHSHTSNPTSPEDQKW